MRHKLFIKLFLIGIMALFLFTGCTNADLETEDITERRAVVSTIKASQDLIEQAVELSGTVAANQIVTVLPKMGGEVSQVPVRVGQRVNKGDMIARLDAEELAVQLQQAEAGVAVAEANLAATKSGVRAEEIAQAQSGLNRAKAHYENAKEQLNRMERAYNEGAVSLQQYESAQLQLVEAEAGYLSAQETLKMLESGATKESLDVIKAQIQQAEAQVAMIRTQLNNTIITAPIQGIVAVVNIEPGELAGQGPIATVINTDKVKVQLNVSEGNINSIKSGDEVLVKIPAVNSESFTGTVSEISPLADFQTRQFPVTISLENKDGLIKPGMFAQIHLVTAKQEEAIIIPKEAVITVNGEKFVFVIENDKAKRVQVELGIENNSMIQVISGIEADEEIITRGQHRLEDGQAVVVENGGDN